ncbi:hypothetical protein HPB51_010546 [Rhipicephalus microplus]|uniref:Uncharacterized protein n=1 Tax=Rhipicephalus microplus TaxID=6941 RepID=A0A9J6E8N1_RHIMP|nr:hypothetical protein HPB51_010546 [Rhipicephalus microplus]
MKRPGGERLIIYRDLSSAKRRVVLSAVAAVVLLTPLSWPFVLCFSCRVATWMYRLYLIALVVIVAFATCCPSRRQDLVNDMYRYSVPPDFDEDILHEEPPHGSRSVVSSDSLGFKWSEHLSVAETKRLNPLSLLRHVALLTATKKKSRPGGEARTIAKSRVWYLPWMLRNSPQVAEILSNGSVTSPKLGHPQGDSTGVRNKSTTAGPGEASASSSPSPQREQEVNSALRPGQPAVQVQGQSRSSNDGFCMQIWMVRTSRCSATTLPSLKRLTSNIVGSVSSFHLDGVAVHWVDPGSECAGPDDQGIVARYCACSGKPSTTLD